MEITDPIFVHAADLHLGAPLKSIGKALNPRHKQELVESVRKAFNNLIDATIRLNAEFIVLAGDIYDEADRVASAQFDFYNGLKKLVENRIGVYIVHGNHDPLTNDVQSVVNLPEEVVVFKSGSVTEIFHKLRDGSEVLIAGISFGKQHENENLALKFRGIQPKHARAVIGLLHTNVGGVSGHDNYAPCSENDLKGSAVDYWALGHVHQRTIGELGSNRFWAYPGNLHGRHDREQGEKGALIIPILKKGVGKPQFIPLHEFSFKTITVDCTKLTGIEEVAEIIKTELKKNSLDKKVILTVKLEGRSRLYDVVKSIEDDKKKNQESIEASLENMIGVTEDQVLIEKIVSSLLPDIELGALTMADDLLGDLLTNLKYVTRNDLTARDNGEHNLILTEEEFISLKNQMQCDFVDDFLSASDGQA